MIRNKRRNKVIKINFNEIQPQFITVKIGKNKIELKKHLRNYEIVALYDKMLDIALRSLDFLDLHNYTQIAILKDMFKVDYCILSTDIDFSECDYEEVLSSGIVDDIIENSVEFNNLWGEFLEILKMENTRSSLRDVLNSVPTGEQIDKSIESMAKYTAQLESENPHIMDKLTNLSLLNHATEAGKETLKEYKSVEKKKTKKRK
jgi:hypothetical protein